MKFAGYLAAIAVLFAVVVLAAGSAAAQTHPNQYGGGRVSGFVYGYNMWNELIPLDWVPITASGGEYSFTTYSYAGGGYEMFLPTGTFNLTASEPGYKPYSMSVTVSNGASLNGFNFYLERSNVPIPEFPAQSLALILVAALAGALIAKRSIRRKA